MPKFTSTDSGATILSKLNNTVVTVGMETGADYVCDGTADDVQIQAALNAVYAKGGGVVFIRSGTYNFSSTLVSPFDSVQLLGEGSSVTIFKLSSGATYNIIDGRTASTTVDFSIEGIGFDGNNEAGGGAGLIALDGVTNFRMEKCEVKNGTDSGVFIGVGGDKITIRDNDIHNNAGSAGIVCWSRIYNSVVKNNKCYSNTTHGIWFAIYTEEEATYRNNNNIIEGNICYSNGYAGIYIDSGNYYTNIIGNLCYSNVTSNIYIYGSDDNSTGEGEVEGLTNDVLIANNICHGNANQGNIFCYKTGSRFLITGNKVTSGESFGIRLSCPSAGGKGYVIEGNYVYNNVNDGIFAYFLTSPIIANNQSHYNGDTGIILYEGNSNFQLTGNYCYDNSQTADNSKSGISIIGGDYSVISGNISTGSRQKYGLETVSSDYFEIIGNNFHGNHTATSIAGSNNDVAHNLS